ncbi:biotin/lipoyl-containing protein [Chloroflexus sp.]|uniref:biotin/lipoyl-containing protein n=1 Tax=Chloroflexus sp. TaxID=1904827 RepID=UPI00298F0D2E|nr:biotin/lipoyl-containing protein [Chloroflexus sp.]MDW8405874.1 biotin/lipoyl-containing protein [Chloroflexus sp.]
MRRYQLTINGKTYTVDITELSSDRFAVQLDGREFEVQLSESGEVSEIAPRAAPLPVAQPAAPAAPMAPPPPAALPPAVATGDNLIRAPMPGTILQIIAQPGAKVKRGQPIIVLEAMKMNNSIGAPRDGVVAAILVKTGQSVGYGEPLAQLAEG